MSLLEGRRGGDLHGVAYSVLGLACLAGDWERWHKAALQHGTDKAFFEQIAQPVWTPKRDTDLTAECVTHHFGNEFGSVDAKGRDEGWMRLSTWPSATSSPPESGHV